MVPLINPEIAKTLGITVPNITVGRAVSTRQRSMKSANPVRK
jgi:hypothetical protein